jgi:hypothetical protein
VYPARPSSTLVFPRIATIPADGGRPMQW